MLMVNPKGLLLQQMLSEGFKVTSWLDLFSSLPVGLCGPGLEEGTLVSTLVLQRFKLEFCVLSSQGRSDNGQVVTFASPYSPGEAGVAELKVCL